MTATWNSASTIRSTMESVLAQTHGDVEHIVIDGASSDETAEIVRSYAQRYEGAGKRLVLASERDRGIYDAMNKGLHRATGDVVGLLNSDDFFTSPDVLACVAKAFADAGADMGADAGADTASDAKWQSEALQAVYGDIHYVDPGDLSRMVRYYSSRRFRRWKMRLGYMPAHPSFYCLRDVYTRLGLYDISFPVAADFELLLRFIYVGRLRTRYLPLDFVTMRTGGASTSGMASHRRILADHLRAYRKNLPSSPGALNLLLDITRYPFKLLEQLF